MSDTVYEGMFILDAGRYARDPAAAAKQVETLLAEQDAEVLVSRLWEERRLAYPINGQRKGVYWLTYFKLPPDNVKQLNRQTEINDTVLRHLVLRLHPQLADAIVAHALDLATDSNPPEDEPAAGKGEPPAEQAVPAVTAGETS